MELQEIYVIELRITLDGKQSLQLCGTSMTKGHAEVTLSHLPKPKGHEFKIVRYVPAP